MNVQIVIAGFGGQGVLSIGKLLAEGAMMEGHEACFLPSYGAEMRGGTSNVTVIIADEQIRCPVAIPGKVDIVAALNKPSLEKFQAYLKQGGILITNSDLISGEEYRDDVYLLEIAANTIAEQLGSVRASNMVISGAIQKAGGFVKEASLIKVLQGMFAKKEKGLLVLNDAALRAGINEVKK